MLLRSFIKYVNDRAILSTYTLNIFSCSTASNFFNFNGDILMLFLSTATLIQNVKLGYDSAQPVHRVNFTFMYM